MTEPCDHPVISHNQDGFFCTACGEPVVLRTRKGTIIAPSDVDRWVAEAEEGYDL